MSGHPDGPRRTCVACRQTRPKRELLRLVRAADGVVRLDVVARTPGRGAYICSDARCLARVLRGGRLGHAFRKPSEVGSELEEDVRTRVRSMSKASGS